MNGRYIYKIQCIRVNLLLHKLTEIKLVGFEQDWPKLKNIYKFIIFLFFLLKYTRLMVLYKNNLYGPSISCCKQVDPTVPIVVIGHLFLC